MVHAHKYKSMKQVDPHVVMERERASGREKQQVKIVSTRTDSATET